MLPFPDSLCHRCEAHRQVRTKTSLFVMCTALPVKYPRQPVLHCAAFRPAPTGASDPPPRDDDPPD